MNMNNGLKIKQPATYQNCVDFRNDNNPDEDEPPISVCTAVQPGICGLPPCGDPMWDCRRECPEQQAKCLSERGG